MARSAQFEDRNDENACRRSETTVASAVSAASGPPPADTTMDHLESSAMKKSTMSWIRCGGGVWRQRQRRPRCPLVKMAVENVPSGAQLAHESRAPPQAGRGGGRHIMILQRLQPD